MDDCTKLDKRNPNEKPLHVLLAPNPDETSEVITDPPIEICSDPKSEEFVVLACDLVQPRGKQVRTEFRAIEELSASIQAEGQIQPIRVSPPNKDGVHFILQGERRWRACSLLDTKQVKAIIDYSYDDPVKIISSQLAENIQREDLSPLEIAEGLDTLANAIHTETGSQPSHNDLSKLVSKSKTYVTKHLTLLKMPEQAQSITRDLVNNDLCRDADSLNNLRKLFHEDEDAFFELCSQSLEEQTLLSRNETKLALEKQHAETAASTSDENKVSSPSQDENKQELGGNDGEDDNQVDNHKDDLADSTNKQQKVTKADWSLCKGSALFITVNCIVNEELVTGYLMTDRACADEDHMYVAYTDSEKNAHQVKVPIDTIQITRQSLKR